MKAAPRALNGCTMQCACREACLYIVSPDLAAWSPAGAVSVALALAGTTTASWRQLGEGMFRVSAV